MSDETPVIPISEFHKFLGYFVNEFAQLEYGLRYLIQKMSGLDEDRFRSLVGFPRSGESRAMALRLARLQPLSDEAREAVEDAFAQLAPIVVLRDRVVHYGGISTSNDTAILFSKEVAGRSNYESADMQTMWNAATDLFLIKNILVFRLVPGADKLEGFKFVRRGPWRYKPPQPPSTRPNYGTREGPLPPPTSSPE